MLTLYVETGCPYSAKVRREIDAQKLEAIYKNVDEPGIWDEVVAKGGLHQVPYFVDDERGVAMYGSDDIVEYLRSGKTSFGQRSKTVGACPL